MSRPRRLRFEQLESLVMLSGAPSDVPSLHDPTATYEPNVPALYSSQWLQSATALWPQAAAEPIAAPASITDTTPPTVTSYSPPTGAAGVFTAATVSFTFSEPIDPTTVTTSNIQLLDGTTPVAGSLTYHAASRTATLTPTSLLAHSKTYTILARGGASGITDVAGNALAADLTSSFTTAAAASPTYSLFPTATPAQIDSGDGQPIELGVRISSAQDGYITAVRFYKSAANTGPHTGSLWTLGGQLLAQAPFTNETPTGWQQVDFPSPVPINAGTSYIASYHTSSGHYSVTRSFFTSSVVSGPLFGGVDGVRANGVYAYGSGGFPTNSYQSTNYWVDVVLEVDPPVDNIAPRVLGIGPSPASPNEMGTQVPVEAKIKVYFDESLDVATVNASNIILQGPGGVTVPSTLSYYEDSDTKRATLTPDAPLDSSTEYTIFVRGGTSGIKDIAGNPLPVDETSTFTTAAPGETLHMLFGDNWAPQQGDSGDDQPIELGVKFQSSTDGFLTGIRFFKSELNTGTHVARLWSATGALLASATFTGETISGWQQVNFDVPVAITAGATYTASYHTTKGHYAATTGFFATPFTAGPLTALASGGVFRYGPGGFPTQSYQAKNYWVDAIFTTTSPPDTAPPTIDAISPGSGATNIDPGAAVTVTFSEAMDPATIDATTIRLLEGATPVAASVAYDAQANTATLTPSVPLANSTTYTISITGGAGGVADEAGNPLAANATSSFTTAAAGGTTYSLFDSAGTPAVIDGTDSSAIELGVKFQASTDGYLTGIRFYKAAGNTGTHTAHLWSSSGQLLASATFTGESASGWQEVSFDTPVAITAGTTYTASYHTATGRYSYTRNFFGGPFTNGPLTALASGGVYRYGASGFPTQSYQATNYWVDAVFTTTPPVDNTPPTVAGLNPPAGVAGVAPNTTVTVTFSEAMDPATISSGTIRLLDGATPVAASVSYNASTFTATLTPSAPLANSTTYTISVTGGPGGACDLAGNPLASNATSSFTTAGSTYSLFDSSGTPAVIDSGDAQPIEVGVKFQSSAGGYLSGVRFYKAPGNNGTHTAHLWSSSGQLLATATFTGESTSGWQEVSFDYPVGIAAGETYTASYHTTSGRYSYTRNFFNSPLVSGPLTALAGGGVYRYGTSGLPTQSYLGTNYWVDPVFTTG